MILVLGATGTNGRPLVKALLERGARVRALTRDAKKAEGLKSAGAEVAVGDPAALKTVAPALAGCERVVMLSAVSQQIPEQEGAIAQAAKAAGARQIVKFSANGADPKSRLVLGRLHGEAEEAVAKSGLACTNLRPTFFMQNLLWASRSIKKDGMFRSNLGTARAAHVDARDIAAVAARILTDPFEDHARKSYELRGPQALSYDEIAAIFTRVLGRPVRYVDMTDDEHAQGMVKSGMPEWLAKAVAELAELARSGSAGHVNDIVGRIGQKKPGTVEEFLLENKAAFVAGNG